MIGDLESGRWHSCSPRALAAGARTTGPDDHDHQSRKDGQQIADAPAQVKTFNVGANGSLKLSNVSGDVRVTGGSGTEIKVEAVIHGKGKTDAEARAQFDTVTVDMRHNGNRVDVETKHERNSRAWVDYTVVVPKGASIDVRTVSGDVRQRDRRHRAGRDGQRRRDRHRAWPRSRRCAASRATCRERLVVDGAVSLDSVSGDVMVKGLKARLGDSRRSAATRASTAASAAAPQSSSVSGDVVYTGHARQGRPLRVQLALGRHRAADAERLRARTRRRSAATCASRASRGQGETDWPGRAARVAARSAAAARSSRRRPSRATCASTARAEPGGDRRVRGRHCASTHGL